MPSAPPPPAFLNFLPASFLDLPCIPYSGMLYVPTVVLTVRIRKVSTWTEQYYGEVFVLFIIRIGEFGHEIYNGLGGFTAKGG